MRGLTRLGTILACVALVAAPVPARSADALETTYAAIQPSLVLIGTYKGKKLIALGSGFVVGNRDGHALVLTNRHVIAGGNAYRGLRQYPKSVNFDLKPLRVGSRDDLALLESSGGEAPAVTIADDLPPLGRHIAISGYPSTQLDYAELGLGLTPSLHEGTVNAKPGNGYYVQYDAQTEHGNSGGPLFDVTSGIVYAIVDLISTKGVQSNLAIGNPRIRAFLANAGVAFAHAAPDAPALAQATASASAADPYGPNPYGRSASTTPVARASAATVASGPIGPECATAYQRFSAVFDDVREAYNRYTSAAAKTTGSASGTLNSLTALVVRINLRNEIKAIHSVIEAEEPKLAEPLAAVQRSGATTTASKLQKLLADVKQRDQDALTWTNERSAAFANYVSYGYLGTVDPAPLTEANTLSTTIDADVTDVKGAPCAS